MQLHRLAPATQRVYIDAVRSLATFYHQSPDRLTPRQVQDYLHHLLVDRKLSWSSCNIATHAFRFLYVKTLEREEFRLGLPRCRREQKLPEILSTEEVERLLTVPGNPKHRALLMTTYAAGLRVGEVVRLQLTDINSARMAIIVRQGKGYKDRHTLLSPRLLNELRAYWKLQRPQLWLFPGKDPKGPLNRATAGKIYRQAKQDAGIKRRGGIHTLRHCFATHLLESGVDPRTLQILLGHRSLKTTVRYLQVTRDHALSVRSPLDLLALDHSQRS